MSNEQVAPPERIWLSRGHPGDSWEWTGCWSPRPHPKGHESTEYIRLDLVEQESLNDRIPNLDRPPAKKWTETPMAERYPPSDTAALAKQGSPRCVKCGHGRVGENGHCVIPVRESDGEDVIEGLCGCKCEFALAKQGSPPADERVNCGTPPDRIWVHPWREMLYYSPTDQPDYIEYTRVSALVEKDKEIKELHTALADQRRQLGADYDKLNDELGRVRIAAYGEIQRLQTALEAARTSEKP